MIVVQVLFQVTVYELQFKTTAFCNKTTVSNVMELVSSVYDLPKVNLISGYITLFIRMLLKYIIVFTGRSRNLLEFPKSRVTEDGGLNSVDQDDEVKFISDMAELLQFHNPLVGDHDYEPPPLKRSRVDDKVEDIKPSLLSSGKDYIVPPSDEIWPPPPTPGDSRISNMIEKALGEEMKVNISDAGGTRTVVLQVPKEQ
jgi:hypothetical protein